jgi:hypothetical protein
MNVPIFRIVCDRHFHSLSREVGCRSACEQQSLCGDPKVTNG